MKIIITGASGNIGSRLFSYLKENKKDEIVGLTKNQEDGLENTDYCVNNLANIFKGADVIIHLAARRGTENNYSLFKENETLTENILKAMVNANVKRIIFLSSIAVYSDQKAIPWTEEQELFPQSAYGVSKQKCEQLIKNYSLKGIEYTIFRCSVVYGGDVLKRMISIFIDNAKAKEKLLLNGKSTAKRDFIYVGEVINALVWSIYELKTTNQIYNLGSGEPLTNLEVATKINECFDNVGNLTYNDSFKEAIINSYFDLSKIKNAGYKHLYSFWEGLQKIKLEDKK